MPAVYGVVISRAVTVEEWVGVCVCVSSVVDGLRTIILPRSSEVPGKARALPPPAYDAGADN